MGKRHVLITGSAGRVASILRQHWGDRYRLRLADVRPVADLDLHEEYVELDITDLEAFTAACGGIDTVLHLAASGLLPELVVAEYHRGVQWLRGGATGRLPMPRIRLRHQRCVGIRAGRTGGQLGGADLPAECLRCYQVLGRGPSTRLRPRSCPVVHCVRLHSPTFDQSNFAEDATDGGISPRDAANLFAACIDADEEVGFAMIHGASYHKDNWFLVSSSDPRVAYEPQDGTAFPRT